MFLPIHSTTFILPGRKHFACKQEMEKCNKNKITLTRLSSFRNGSCCLGAELTVGNSVTTRGRRRHFLVRNQGSDQHESKNVFPGMTIVNLI
jgi:hypothetical protein